MSNESLVLIDRRSDGVALVTLNSPKVNALSTALLARLHDVASELTSNPAGAVVITGGDRLFAAGADISEFGGPSEAKTIGAAFQPGGKIQSRLARIGGERRHSQSHRWVLIVGDENGFCRFGPSGFDSLHEPLGMRMTRGHIDIDSR